MRVLKWMLERIEGSGTGTEHVFGVSPKYDDMTWEGVDFTREQFDQITAIDTAAWREELKLHDELFALLEQRLPAELLAVRKQLDQRLGA